MARKSKRETVRQLTQEVKEKQEEWNSAFENRGTLLVTTKRASVPKGP